MCSSSFLRSPLIDRQAQTKGILAVLEAAKVSDLVRRFVAVVGSHRRLFALPGIGPYTARAVLAFAYERDVGVVDTNIARVLARAGGGIE